jgi:hypothetical protein
MSFRYCCSECPILRTERLPTVLFATAKDWIIAFLVSDAVLGAILEAGIARTELISMICKNDYSDPTKMRWEKSLNAFCYRACETSLDNRSMLLVVAIPKWIQL